MCCGSEKIAKKKKKGTFHYLWVWGESHAGGSFGQGSASSVMRGWKMVRSPSLVPGKQGSNRGHQTLGAGLDPLEQDWQNPE